MTVYKLVKIWLPTLFIGLVALGSLKGLFVSILQAVWALGNVACDSYSSRDIVLQHGALVPLLQLFNGRTKLAILWKATWALGIFCRSLPPDKFEHV
jgi:hypothetical protein